MRKSTTAERLQWIMKARRLRQVDILEAAKPYCERYKIKLGRNDLSQYVHGTVEPGQQKLTILGMALNVSEVWLMGYDVPMQREALVSTAGERTKEFAELFSKLTEDQQMMILQAMKGIAAGK